jgi:formate dehydrogenase major subunit
MVNVTIDDKTIQVPEGTTVLRAAEKAGIQIPTLCDLPSLQPFGGCRLCVVEVEGMRALQPSCSFPVSNNMIVRTTTEKVVAARNFVLTLIFSDRNHFCPFCQVSGGDCELQNAALKMGMTHWDYQPNWKSFPVDASHKYLVLDHNRCILCRRCVRACGELVGNFTLGVEERGANSMLVCDTGVAFGSSSCISCGTCSQVCPTGAIIDRHSAYQGLKGTDLRTPSVCVECSVGCGNEVLSRDNRLVRLLGRWDAQVNGGVLCESGRFKPLDDNRERVHTPMLRVDGKLQPATWDQALEAVSRKISPLAGKNGQGVAAVASPRLPVEPLVAFKKLFKDGFKSGMVTSLEEGIFTSAGEAVAAESGAFEAGLSAFKAADCVVTIGIDLTKETQVVGFMIKRILPANTALIVVDPAENGFDPFARFALKPAAGTESELLHGLSAALDPEAAGANAALKVAAQKTGISVEDMIAVSGIIARSTHPVFVYGKGLNLVGLKDLVTFSKKIGAKSALIGSKGAANSLAAAQLSFDQPFKRGEHQAVYVALGDDTPSQHFIQEVEGAPFLVVQASYVSRLTAMADVVLPVEMWAEQEGHFVNLEGRVQSTSRSLTAPQGVLSNLAVIEAVASKVGIDTAASWKDELKQRKSPVPIV